MYALDYDQERLRQENVREWVWRQHRREARARAIARWSPLGVVALAVVAVMVATLWGCGG